jgi:hypothetical protein
MPQNHKLSVYYAKSFLAFRSPASLLYRTTPNFASFSYEKEACSFAKLSNINFYISSSFVLNYVRRAVAFSPSAPATLDLFLTAYKQAVKPYSHFFLPLSVSTKRCPDSSVPVTFFVYNSYIFYTNFFWFRVFTVLFNCKAIGLARIVGSINLPKINLSGRERRRFFY